MAYESYFTHGESVDDDPMNAGGDLIQRSKQAVLRHYIRLRFGQVRDWRDWAFGGLAYLYPRQRLAFDTAMRHLPRPAALSTLLDIGCGSGRFMAWARAAGWSCTGTELDSVAAGVARSRGFEVTEEDISELVKTGRRFNAITVSHVIEHVHDPETLLMCARELLEPGGVFWIETPNLNAHGHDVFASAWRGLEPPRHLQLFNLEALHSLMLKVGFCEIKRAPWQLDWQSTFPASLRLAQETNKVPGRKLDASKEESIGKRRPEKREFITLTASTPRPPL